MLPWNYGFHWSTGSIIFLGAFYTVLVVVLTTVIAATVRSRRALASNQAESIRWQSDFHDLPALDRTCRHVLTGTFQHRECPNAFDCRKCQTHSSLIAKHSLSTPTDPDEEIFGMPFPLDRLYHRGHTWLHQEQDGTVTIGLDELGKRLIGEPDDLTLPHPGSRVRTSGTAFHIRKREADVRVLSPVDGEVVETGGTAQGWFLRVRPDASGEAAFLHLLRGSEIRPWLMREMERLQLSLSAEGATPTLADGGVPMADIASCYPKANWDAVCSEMFLHP